MSFRKLLLFMPLALMAGCILTSNKSLIPFDEAEFPIELAVAESATFQSCERNDPADWTDCGEITLTRAEGHYLIHPFEDETDDMIAMRFGILNGADKVRERDFIVQFFNESDPDEEYLYGMARFSGEKLFFALVNPKFISESLCRKIGADDPLDKRSCVAAIDDFSELHEVMDDLQGSEDYTIYIDLTSNAG
jgi:hypothetical protein